MKYNVDDIKWLVGRLLDITEHHYPYYSSSDLIAEALDFLQFGEIVIKVGEDV